MLCTTNIKEGTCFCLLILCRFHSLHLYLNHVIKSLLFYVSPLIPFQQLPSQDQSIYEPLLLWQSIDPNDQHQIKHPHYDHTPMFYPDNQINHH